MFDVVTIGSATVDHFAETDSELIKIDTRTSHESLIAFPLGSKLLIRNLVVTTGGGGTNTAVAFARLGLKTGFLGKIGQDAAASTLREMLAREQITFLGGFGGQTGFSVILNSIEDDRSILAFKGCNNELAPEDIQDFQTRWIYLASMLDQSFETVLDFLRSYSGELAFNPSNYQAQQGYQSLMPLLEKVSLLVFNREEACKLLNRDPKHNLDISPLLRELADLLPCRILLVTDGSKGAWVYDRKQAWHGKPAEGLKIVETTGAGDAFASTFTAGLIRGLELPEALAQAMTNSESVLQHRGAKERLLSLAELESASAASKRIITPWNL